MSELVIARFVIIVVGFAGFVLLKRCRAYEFANNEWRSAYEQIHKERAELASRRDELYEAIREHRDQQGDDRCWMDDQKLYAVLNDGNLGDNRIPPKEKMLQTCSRFIDQRCKPDAGWKSYEELERENINLRISLGRVRHETECALKEREQCDSSQSS